MFLQIVVLGTPAEESGGGKIDLINAGAFKDIDVAMMVHPSRSDELAPLFIGVGHVSLCACFTPLPRVCS